MVSLVTGAVMTVVALLEGDMGWPGLAGLAPLAALAFLPQTLGWLVITANLPQVRVGVAGLVLLLQPILSVLLSRWIFNEVFQPHQVAGAIVTLASVYVGSTRGKG
jgi:drug/metabolite transporter (DMT)-like permease